MDRERNFFDNNRVISLILSLIISAVYSALASSLVGAPFLSLFVVNIITIYLILSSLEIIKTPSLRTIFIIISILKLILVLINAQLKTIPFTGTDWLNYDAMARSAIENSSTAIELYNNSFDLFVFVISCIYSVFGENINQIFFYIIPFSFLTFKYTYKTVITITKNEKRASTAGMLVLAWPVNIIFSVSILRESLIQLLVAVSFYSFVRYIKRGAGLFIAYLFGILTSLTHSGLVAIPLSYTYVLLQRQKDKVYKILSLRSAIITIMVVILVMLSPLWGEVGKHFSNIKSTNDITNILEVKDEALSGANTNYISNNSGNFGSLLASLPYRLTMFTFSPFPWQVRDGGTAIAFIINFIPTLLLLGGFIFTFRNRGKLSKSNQNIITTSMICIVFVFIIFSIGTNNYGTAMRHRSKVLPIMLIVATSYITVRGNKIKMNPLLTKKSGVVSGMSR